MSFGRLARTLALLLLGAMLFVRMGPMCEAIAQAAPPAEAHAGMADCDRAPPTPVKKAPSVDCVGACIATALDVHTSDRKSTRLNSSHVSESRMPSSA